MLSPQRHRGNRLLVGLTVFIAVSVVASYSQETGSSEDQAHVGYWGTVGLGGGRFGPTFGASLAAAWNGNIISARFAKAEEFSFSIGGRGSVDNPHRWFKQLGVLYGRELRDRSLVWSLLAGACYVDGVDRGTQLSLHQFEEKNLSGVGFPIEARAKMEFSRHIGLGLTGFGIFSSSRPIFGWLAEVSLGAF